jgi:ubiquinone/menaquinone biosynthesis C-methylase UbiE
VSSQDNNAQFVGSIPALYDRHLGPALFKPDAEDLSQRVAAAQPDGSVLELACGTGILTRRLRSRLPPAAPLVATDLNQAMVDYAREKQRAATLPGAAIEWKQADAVSLPFPAATFAAVVCQFGLMFVPDKAAAVREARRVLTLGGLLALSVWGDFAHNPIGRIAHETIAGFFPADPPDFYRTPFGFHDGEVLRQLLTGNGFVQVAIECVSLETSSPSTISLATGLVKGNPVSLTIQSRGAALDPIVEAVAAALRQVGATIHSERRCRRLLSLGGQTAFDMARRETQSWRPRQL